MRRSPLPLLLVACSALAIWGCARDTSARPPEPGDRLVARVQDDAVWASDVRREAVAQGLIAEGDPLSPGSDLFRRVLDEVIDQRLLAEEAERRGLDNSALAKRRLEATRQRILGDILVESVVSDTISDQAVETIYREQVRLAQTVDEVRSRLILSRSEEEANALVALLAQGGAFEALAQQRSIDDATRVSGGDLGYATLEVLPRAYADALRDQPKGAVVGPLQTEGGWAVLKVEDRRQSRPPALEQARPQIVRYLTYEGVRQLLEQLRGKAEVEVISPPPVGSRPPAKAAPATAPARAAP